MKPLFLLRLGLFQDELGLRWQSAATTPLSKYSYSRMRLGAALPAAVQTLSCLLALLFTLSVTAQGPDSRPNIILIIADDLS